ncbi:MAG: ABC transporter ATP-binding protein [Erysipelotrichia bacterium]|nr:ABC transporter ATP-binding protein [Erysipelotrichia bacterium]
MSVDLLFGNTSQGISLFLAILAIPGYWLIFKKCGLKPWTALIPIFNDLQLGRCAHCEDDGRKLLVSTGFYSLFYMMCCIPEVLSSSLGILLSICMFITQIFVFIFNLRIYAGLCQVFGQKKIWIVAWILMSGVSSLVWGIVSDFQPSSPAVTPSTAPAAVEVPVEKLEKGLTINLKSRTVLKYMHRKYLLKDIHINIKPGSMVLLLGGSGSGKSTFINAITGYEKANAEMLLNSRSIYHDYREVKYDIGLAPQADMMREHDTVYKTVLDAADMRMPKGTKAAERKKRTEEVLDFIGLGATKENMVSMLSGGQKKRLSIAMELVSNPYLLVLDEPDSGLDGVIAREIMLKLRELADQGHIVIVITHTPDRVRDLFDSTIILARDSDRTGRLAFYGTITGALRYFKKKSMEQILLTINPKKEGGEGRSDEFIEKYDKKRIEGKAYNG